MYLLLESTILTSKGQTVATNRVIPPEERARKMRDDYNLSSEQEKQFVEVYRKVNAIRAEINSHQEWTQDKRFAKYAEWKAVTRDAVRRILTDVQFSEYMARAQGERDRLARQGMSLQEQLKWVRERAADGASDAGSKEISLPPGEKDKLDSALNTSPLEDKFAFSRLRFEFVGQFTFLYQPEEALERIVADVRVSGVNTTAKRETVILPLRRIICDRVSSAAGSVSSNSRGPKHAHTYKFRVSDDVIPTTKQKYFDSNFFKNIDSIRVTISEPSNLPIGGKDHGFDYAVYDRKRAAKLWESWPNLDERRNGSILLTATHATTSQEVTLICKPFGANIWSPFIRDPDRQAGGGEPTLIAEGAPQLDFNCDYLMSSPQYKAVAFPSLFQKK